MFIISFQWFLHLNFDKNAKLYNISNLKTKQEAPYFLPGRISCCLSARCTIKAPRFGLTFYGCYIKQALFQILWRKTIRIERKTKYHFRHLVSTDLKSTMDESIFGSNQSATGEIEILQKFFGYRSKVHSRAKIFGRFW